VKYLPQHHVYPVHGKQVKEGKSNNLIDLAIAARTGCRYDQSRF
jgi:hypothetical protein